MTSDSADAVELRKWWRVLPRNEYLGWTPLAWLLYLPIFFMEPIAQTRAGTAPLWLWPATIAGLLVFLWSYFLGYWVRGQKLQRVALVQTAIGMVFAPINTGSSVFFVYAASFGAQVENPREALRWVIGIAAVGTLTAWLAEAPAYYYITSSVITLLIGGINLHFAQVGRAQIKLRLAQEENVQLAAVGERERIARDLHDVLGHTLSLIILKSELASKLAESDPVRAAREIRDVEMVSRKALQEVREAIRGYRATLEDEVARARSMLKAGGVQAEVDITPVGLPRALEETLAFALREAVTNVVRHARARCVTLTLEQTKDRVALVVQDDGEGTAAPEGSGLRGMRERIEALNGFMEVHFERGTRLRVILPVPAEVDAERISA